MADPTFVPCSFGTILLKIQARLMSVLSFPSERVIITLQGTDPPHIQADQDILLRSKTIHTNSSWTNQTGHFQTYVERRLETVCRTRLALDELGSAAIWLTDATLGHIAFEESVANALQTFFPTDANENTLTYQALEQMDGEPEKQSATGSKPQDWGQSSWFFLVAHVIPMDQSLSLT